MREPAPEARTGWRSIGEGCQAPSRSQGNSQRQAPLVPKPARTPRQKLPTSRRFSSNRFFPKDRCTLANQMSFLLAHSWSAFVLAKGDRHGANKNEVAIFVFSVATKGFSHARAPGWKRGDALRVGKLGQRAGRRQSGFPSAAISKASFARAGPNCLQVLKSVLAGTLQESLRTSGRRELLAALGGAAVAWPLGACAAAGGKRTQDRHLMAWCQCQHCRRRVPVS